MDARPSLILPILSDSSCWVLCALLSIFSSFLFSLSFPLRSLFSFDVFPHCSNTEAEASLICSKATAQVQQLLLEAQSNGTRLLVETAGIATQEQRTAFAYIWTLMNRNNITIELTNLRPENIVQTCPV